MTAYGIIVAGGTGTRMKSDIPKQLLTLDNATLLEWALKPFASCPSIQGIIISAAQKTMEKVQEIAQNVVGNLKPFHVIEGGWERQESVFNAIKAVPQGIDITVIHDAVRPFITAALVDKCVKAAREYGAVTVTLPVRETVKRVVNSAVIETIDRSTLHITQTPQAFKTDCIRAAHLVARRDSFNGTDDSMLVERLGYRVHSIEGNALNIKVTTPEDLSLVRTLFPLFKLMEE